MTDGGETEFFALQEQLGFTQSLVTVAQYAAAEAPTLKNISECRQDGIDAGRNATSAAGWDDSFTRHITAIACENWISVGIR